MAYLVQSPCWFVTLPWVACFFMKLVSKVKNTKKIRCHLPLCKVKSICLKPVIKSCKTCCSVDQLGVSAGLNLAPEPYFWFTAWKACNVNVAYGYVTCCSTEQDCDVKVIVPSFIYSLFNKKKSAICDHFFLSACSSAAMNGNINNSWPLNSFISHQSV